MYVTLLEWYNEVYGIFLLALVKVYIMHSFVQLLHKQSEENLPVCHEVAVQTHAESTAMIAGNLQLCGA